MTVTVTMNTLESQTTITSAERAWLHENKLTWSFANVIGKCPSVTVAARERERESEKVTTEGINRENTFNEHCGILTLRVGVRKWQSLEKVPVGTVG